MGKVVNFAEATHTYTDEHGVVVPSVSQLLRAVGIGLDYDSISGPHRQRVNNKAELSKRVHLAARYLDEGDLDWNTVIEPAVLFVKAWERFCVDEKFVPDTTRTEVPMIGEWSEFRFGLTPDRVGMRGNRKCLADLKCTLQTELKWGPQTAGYVLGLVSEIGGEPEDYDRLAVQLCPDGNYKLHEFTVQHDYATFIGALVTHHFKEQFSPRGSGKCIRTSMYGGPVKVYSQPQMETA